MESQLALQLAKMLKDAEDREKSAREKEIMFSNRMHSVEEREKALTERGEQIHRDAVALEEYRNVAEERQKTIGLMNKIRRDEETLAEQRQLFAKEVDVQNQTIHKAKMELGSWKDRLIAEEADLVKNIELLKQEKIKHHEQVLADIAEIEAKKREVTSANI